MKERINWIDWAKALAVTTVVFCHLPQSQEWVYYRFLQSCIITIFFFLSGYLKRDRGSTRENWRKYWYGLILPYLLYNAIVYPYWIIKFYMLHGGLPDFLEAAKPVIGTLLLEHENAFAEPMNGPLWYLPAILIMHVIVDSCRKTRYQHTILITLCILSYFLYAANKYWEILPNLTPMGIVRRLPYYYIGYLMGQKKIFRSISLGRDFMCCIVCLTVSIILFLWHLQESMFMLHIALFYPVNLCFLFGMLCGCKVLDHLRLSYVTNLSIGTLVIIGLHFPLISLVNYLLGRMFHIQGVICYHWYEALPVALMICLLLYPVILFGKQYVPVLLGRPRSKR